RLSPPAGRATLLIEPPQALGHGTVTATAADGKATTFGFSVNPDPAESSLTSLTAEEMDTLLGKGKYALAEDAEALKRVTTEVRVGREIFPWLMLLILALITAENLLANRFYRREQGSGVGGLGSGSRPPGSPAPAQRPLTPDPRPLIPAQ